MDNPAEATRGDGQTLIFLLLIPVRLFKFPPAGPTHHFPSVFYFKQNKI